MRDPFDVEESLAQPSMRHSQIPSADLTCMAQNPNPGAMRWAVDLADPLDQVVDLLDNIRDGSLRAETFSTDGGRAGYGLDGQRARALHNPADPTELVGEVIWATVVEADERAIEAALGSAVKAQAVLGCDWASDRACRQPGEGGAELMEEAHACRVLMGLIVSRSRQAPC